MFFITLRRITGLHNTVILLVFTIYMNIVYNQSCSKVAKNAQFATFLELYFVKSVTNYQKGYDFTHSKRLRMNVYITTKSSKYE